MRTLATRAAHKTGNQRQQLLYLYLTHPNPRADTVAWSFFDGTSRDDLISTGDESEPPYPTVLAAMRDGWRVLQVAPPLAVRPGMEHRTTYMHHEFVLERMLEIADA